MGLSRARERLLARLRERRGREREALFLVEGIRSAGEALAARARVSFALVSPRLGELAGGAELRGRLEEARLDTVELSDGELAAVADTQTSQGVLLVCAEPDAPSWPAGEGPLLVLDGIQDPGNVGTLLRAAGAFGVADALVLDGSADPYNAKAVRAAAGAIFRARLHQARWEDAAPALLERGPLLVADMGGRDVAALRPPATWTLVIGSEGAGPRPAVRAAATEVVSIPMPGGTESLNAGVAGSILLYVLTQEGTRG
ncbi:MAG: RNA methyltransferase [Gemmatimonadetes bacterium]|nr:RNA methyltransferase [Gemmatimonadota bacterium]